MLSSRNVSPCGGIDETLEAAALPQHSAERLSLSAGVIINFLFPEAEPQEKAGWGGRKAIGFPHSAAAEAAKHTTLPAEG